MTDDRIAYKKKLVAFVDILGFGDLVRKSVDEGDAEIILRTMKRLASNDDIESYRGNAAQICKNAEKLSNDLDFRISQVSDCVVVSAELSPAGAINIVNYCRKIAERLLLREGRLCEGYLTIGEIYHEGVDFFGTGYQDAVDGSKKAGCIEFYSGELGTPFIEIDSVVSDFINECSDDCIKNQLGKMTIERENYFLISPYGIFDRLLDGSVDFENKKFDDIHHEISTARILISKIEQDLQRSAPKNDRGMKKVDISLEKLKEARMKIDQADKMIRILGKPYPEGSFTPSSFPDLFGKQH